jgi:hypothetical protein
MMDVAARRFRLAGPVLAAGWFALVLALGAEASPVWSNAGSARVPYPVRRRLEALISALPGRSGGMVIKAVTMPLADFGMAIWRQPGRRERRTA